MTEPHSSSLLPLSSSSMSSESVTHALTVLLSQQRLRQIDLQLAQQLVGYERKARPSVPGSQQDGLKLAATLTSLVLGRGQVCLPLTHCPLPELAGFWMGATDWVSMLSQCACVWATTDGSGWQNQPLVLECGPGLVAPRVYLARYYFYQTGVAGSIQQRLTAMASVTESGRQADTALASMLAQLFERQANGVVNWQWVAAATACLQLFCVITGGPGTGKTTTVTRLLCALLSQQPQLRIALAAPTGKAAARMIESIRQARQRDDLPAEQLAGIPDESFTLHRLLGWTPNGFRYHARNPLPWDCVVVDEASMIDLAMMHQLLQALPANARLVMLGDKDQLASVEAGSVLADVCNAGGATGPDQAFAARLTELTGFDLTSSVCPKTGLIQNAVAELKVSHRFTASSGIGQLAKAVNAGQVSAAIQCFESFDDIACDWLDSSSPDQTDRLLPWQRGVIIGYREYGRLLGNAASDQNTLAILSAFNHFRVLVATRQGTLGVEAVNQDIERLLVQAGLLIPAAAQSGSWYPGRPVMITRNDYDLGLFNGDVGVLVSTGSGQLRAAFPTLDGHVRYVLPSRLPSHETAFAMTVHKSQGSEFNRVQLLLPERWQGVITRELIYTAITRAREHFYLMSGRECWQRGLGNRVERASGLRDALWKSP